MKKIIITLVFLAAIPSIAFGGNSAPYTEDALQNIVKALKDSPPKKHDKNMSKEEFYKGFVEDYSNIYKMAGYDFNDTINQIIDDMKNNPEAIPADRQSVYNKMYILLLLMMAECIDDKVDCLQFFPPDTKESIQWFNENNGFNKRYDDTHYGKK